MSTEITTTNGKAPLVASGDVRAIVPQDAEQAYRLAGAIHQAGMAPKGFETPQKVMVAIMTGLEVGLKPMQALQGIAIVNGRPTIWGDAAIGLVLGSGQVEELSERTEGDGEGMVAICTAKRKGVALTVEQRFSVADAKLAGLWGKAGPWKQYPRRMLQMRARAFALRDAFADVLKGVGIAEEVRDYQHSVDHETAPDLDDVRKQIQQQASQPPKTEPPASESPEPTTAADEPLSSLAEFAVESMAREPGLASLEQWKANNNSMAESLEPHERDAIDAAYDKRRKELGG